MDNSHLVSQIDLTGFGGHTLRIGDLNGDGAPDFLFAQSIHGTREITCLTAFTLSGQILWQYGKPDAKNGLVYSDLPVQIYDWDNDGHNEVLFVRQSTYAEPESPELWYRERAIRYEGTAVLIVLDGKTGQEKDRFALPAPADDSILFADLTGRGRREDLVVKDRYWNMWGISHEGAVLWHWEGATGHYPTIADVDGDGCDEVFIGFTLLDHDGQVLWQIPAGNDHSDANCIVQASSGEWRFLFGNGGVHCLDIKGHEVWYQKIFEAQHLISGRFCPQLPDLQFVVIDRGPSRVAREGKAALMLFDFEGRELWKRELPPGSWCATMQELDWSGNGEAREILLSPRDAAMPVEIYNGSGEVIQSFAPLMSFDEPYNAQISPIIMAADMWGDSREEVIIYNTTTLSVYANATPNMKPRHYNYTHYRGM